MTPFRKKIVALFLVLIMLSASTAELAVLLYPRPAQAQAGILSAIGLGGEDALDTGCSMGGIGGECVPVLLQSDPKRATNNRVKNVLTGILYGATIAFGKWMQHSIDQKFGIRDYYGYNRSLTDVIYRYRILFERYLDPDSRVLADIAYNTVTRGSADYNQIKTVLQTLSNNTFSEVVHPLTPASPNFFANLALAGQWGSSSYDWYHITNDQALANIAAASAAAAQEISQSQGYKSSRTKQDLAFLTQPKNAAFYSSALDITRTGQIITPGFVAAKALQISMQKLMEHYKLTSNVTAAIATEIALDVFFSSAAGGIFKQDTAAVGNTIDSDTFYSTGATTDTSSTGAGGGLPVVPPDCTIDTDGDGVNDSYTAVGGGLSTDCNQTPTIGGLPNCDIAGVSGGAGYCTEHSSGAACNPGSFGCF